LSGKPAALQSGGEWKEAGMFDDENAPRKKKSHEVGMVIDTMSVDELEERIGLLEAEIVRLREAIVARRKTKDAANSVFKF
jgi:uncharacterized small protein (DUF1192 family)